MDQDQRFDEISHWPENDQRESRSNCKMDGCKSLTNVYCTKCNIHLCFLKTRNCFRQYHKPATQTSQAIETKKESKKSSVSRSLKKCRQSGPVVSIEKYSSCKKSISKDVAKRSAIKTSNILTNTIGIDCSVPGCSSIRKVVTKLERPKVKTKPKSAKKCHEFKRVILIGKHSLRKKPISTVAADCSVFKTPQLVFDRLKLHLNDHH